MIDKGSEPMIYPIQKPPHKSSKNLCCNTGVGPTVTRVAGPAGGVGPAFSSRPLGGANGLLATSAVPTAVAGL